jgi:hypothetical protein
LFPVSRENTTSTNLSILKRSIPSLKPARENKRWRRAWKIELIEKLNPDRRDLTNELNF